MTEDQSHRPYRSSESIARTGQPRGAASGNAGPANDPLAELARLIGQSDPFGDAANTPARTAEPASIPPAVEWSAPATQPHAQQSFARSDFAYEQPTQHAPARGQAAAADHPYSWVQPLGPVPDPAGLYQVEQEIPAYLTNRAPSTAPSHEPYAPGADEFGGEQDAYYDDYPPPRRRLGVMIVAAIFGIAVLGTAGAFGYRTLFGSGSRVPPVIQADKAPLKVVPDNGQGGKAIADRVTDQGEKILAREEKPVDIEKLAQAALQNTPAPGAGASPLASAGNGVIAGEPKKVHTIVIRPDGSSAQSPVMASPMPPDSAQASAPAAPTSPARPKADREAPVRAAQPAAPAPVQEASAGNAPLSLNPDSAPSTRPVRMANAVPTASAPASAPRSNVTAYAVQVASQKSEPEAKAAYQAIVKKYPKVLEGKNMFVYSVDLGAKGTYYRAMVGPYSVASEATEVCSELKSAGGSCLIQRNP